MHQRARYGQAQVTLPSGVEGEMRIRDVRPGDLPEVLRMVEALARHLGDEPGVTLEGLRADLCGAGRWGFGLVAVAGGLAGYAILTRLVQVQFGRRGMDLHHLFVRPDQRGQGMGALLLRGAEAKAAGLGALWVTVSTHPENHAAQAFYKAQGYDPMHSTVPRFVRRLQGP